MKINDNVMNEFFDEWYNKFDKLSHINKRNNQRNFIPINNKLNYENMKKNLQIIFGEHTNVDKQVCLFEDVLDFLINGIKVEGADRLFSKHFYDIEWNMFLEADFSKGKMKVYRDHFVHQIRNAFMGYFLIWEYGLVKNIKVIIKDNQSAFSDFINCCDEDKANQDFYDVVIMKSWYIAALFHDIGYPIAYHQRNSAKMDKYMPYLRVIDNRRQMDFVELLALLSDSYLFKMVDYEELKRSYEKFDHGMLSAICLLLHYYHTGAINRLSKEDYCAIELAAYSIYVHTRKYGALGDKSASKQRPLFCEDPLAYLLRLCDDLQEWSRVYFIVDNNSNILICDECKGTIQRSEDDDHLYVCRCNKTFNKLTSINYRKINFVEVCEEIELLNSEEGIKFSLNYNMIKLLEVIGMDEQYAYYRNKELDKLGLLLEDQDMLPKIEIDYFLSDNHTEIKLRIIKQALKGLQHDSVEDKFITDPSWIIEQLRQKIGAKELDKVIATEVEEISSYLKENKGNVRNLITRKQPPKNYLLNLYLYREIYNLN